MISGLEELEEVKPQVKTFRRGDRVGPYVIIRRVPGGVGGMAAVYEAKLYGRGKSVAIKVAHTGLAGFLKDEGAFTVAIGLNHPHIIKLLPTPIGPGSYDYLVRDPKQGVWFFAMEFMAGGSLRDWLNRRKRLPIPVALEVLKQIGSALDAAHRAGIVHLDVKPSNILFRENPERAKKLHAVLTDFGIARPKGQVDGSQQTLTVEYASPEQAMLLQKAQVEVGPASDLYSLATVFYEMITGTLPFRADNELALLHHIIYEPLPSPIPGIPPQLEPILARALAKNPAERYPSAQALVEAIESALPEIRQAKSEIYKLNPVVSGIMGLVIGIILGFGGGFYMRDMLSKGSTATPVPAIYTITPRKTIYLPTNTPEPTIKPTSTPTLRPTSTRAPTLTFTPTPRPTLTPVATTPQSPPSPTSTPAQEAPQPPPPSPIPTREG